MPNSDVENVPKPLEKEVGAGGDADNVTVAKSETSKPADDGDDEEENEESDEEEKEEEEMDEEEKDEEEKEDEEKEDDAEGSEDDDEAPYWDPTWEILEPGSGLLERPYVLEEGKKRERKKTERIDVKFDVTPKDKTIEIPEGKGVMLGDMPRVDLFINKKLSTDLRKLHIILFGKAGNMHRIKVDIRKFCGFAFEENTPEFDKKLLSLLKVKMSFVKECCEVLDVERGGTKNAVVERLMTWLMNPQPSGKPLPTSKRKSKGGSGTDTGGKKKRKRKRAKKAAENEPEKKKKKVESVDEDSADESQSTSQGDESPKKKKAKKDESPKKTPKKKATPKKETKSKSAEKSPARKKKTPVKKKTTPKKIQEVSDISSSTDSSDDEPLIMKKPIPPTDEELKQLVRRILDGANLEEITMKTVCRQVYDKYPAFDLTDRKDFIKTTVKSIIQ